MKTKKCSVGLWTAVSVTACALIFTSCQSSPRGTAGSDSLSSITITNRSTLEAARAVSEVFQQAGYTPVPLPSNKATMLVFEKEGGTGDTILYGDFSAKKLWYRAKVRFSPLGPDSRLVTCDAFRVRNHGEEHFEEESRLSRMKHGYYQDLLNRAKARLGP